MRTSREADFSTCQLCLSRMPRKSVKEKELMLSIVQAFCCLGVKASSHCDSRDFPCQGFINQYLNSLNRSWHIKMPCKKDHPRRSLLSLPVHVEILSDTVQFAAGTPVSEVQSFVVAATKSVHMLCSYLFGVLPGFLRCF